MTKEIYTIENVCRALNSVPGIQVKGKSIKIAKTAIVGNKSWGKIDFLKKNGFVQEFINSSIEVNQDSKKEFEENKEYKRKKKKNGIDTLSGVKSIMKMSNFKIKK